MQKLKVKNIKKLNEKQNVYDLTVQENHNFFIGKNQILTHNCDYMSTNAQAALRNLMETYSQHTRFILTCNYVEKIIEPLISRCQLYTLSSPSKKDIAKRLSDILILESIKFELADVAFIVKAYYPDIRKIINNAQKQSVDGILSINKEEIVESDFKLKILEILKDKSKSKKDSFTEIRQLVADNNIYNFIDIYKLLFDNINDYAVGNIATVILILAEMQYKSSISVDQELLFMSTVLQILDKIR